MGRKAGVSAEQTRGVLLEAAARVFARKGYDGASIADITNEAGLSSGAIYAHYGGKAELFVAVVQQHSHRGFADLVGPSRAGRKKRAPANFTDVADFVTKAGASYLRRDPAEVGLLIEVIVAAKRDPEVADLVRSWLADGESLLGAALHDAQASGSLDDSIDHEVLTRFITTVALGTSLTAALGLPSVDAKGWARLIERLVDAVRIEGHEPE